MTDAPTDRPTKGPVLVGGTGRSGTTIVGELLGQHADLALVPVELRLHCDPGGLTDLAAGTVGMDGFERRLLRRWYRRKASSTGPRGVHVFATKEETQALLDVLREELAAPDADRWAACGRFLDSLLQPIADRAGARTWVEMTPPNSSVFDGLARMLPTARFVHMVRDGRDVAASVVGRSWGPDDMPGALAWWGDRMVEALTAAHDVPADRLLTLRLESLIGGDREGDYTALERFVGDGPDAGMRAFFDSRMTSDAAHPGRWSRDRGFLERRRINAQYAEQCARVAALGLEMPDGVELVRAGGAGA